MDVSKFTSDELILAGLALLLVIDLLFLPWFNITIAFGTFKESATSTATGSPDGWLGVLAMLTALALMAYMAFDRLAAGVEVPAIGGNPATTRLVLAAATAGFVGLKFLFHIHFDLFGIGFWGAVVLSTALVAVAVRARDAEPAMPTLA